jgi:hypothetical protein
VIWQKETRPIIIRRTMNVVEIAQNSGNVLAKRTQSAVGRRTLSKVAPSNLEIGGDASMTVGTHIEMVQTSVRARYTCEFMRYIGSVEDAAINDIRGTTVLLILIGACGRVASLPELEAEMPDSMIASLMHLQNCAGEEKIELSFCGEAPRVITQITSDEDMTEQSGKIAAILLKAIISQETSPEMLARAYKSVSNIRTRQPEVKVGVKRLVAGYLSPKTFKVWGSMLLRSQLLLACSYAHLDGSLTFARNTSGMANEKARQEIVSGVRTRLVSVVGRTVYTGGVPSIYHCWAEYIPPYRVYTD